MLWVRAVKAGGRPSSGKTQKVAAHLCLRGSPDVRWTQSAFNLRSDELKHYLSTSSKKTKTKTKVQFEMCLNRIDK